MPRPEMGHEIGCPFRPQRELLGIVCQNADAIDALVDRSAPGVSRQVDVAPHHP